MFGDIGTLNLKKAEYLNVIEKTKELKLKRDAAIATLNSIPATDLERLGKIIPSQFDGVMFLNDANALATKYSLKITAFTANKPDTASRDATISQQYITNTIKMTVTGSYSQFVKFLKDIETSLQLFDVVNLSIDSAVAKSPTDNNLEYKLDINTYSLK
jgi:Tfp pilus assembly protein PilO